jgi:hypothetical protein
MFALRLTQRFGQLTIAQYRETFLETVNTAANI